MGKASRRGALIRCCPRWRSAAADAFPNAEEVASRFVSAQ
jgi:hypothetical protein